MNLTIRCARATATDTSPIAHPIPRRYVQAWLEAMFPKPEPQLLHARLSYQNTSTFPDTPLVSLGAMCDWLFIENQSDPHFPHQTLRLRSPPRTVFVDLRFDLKTMIQLVRREVLPNVKKPVVILSTSQDRTIPQQRDFRFGNVSHAALKSFIHLLDERHIERWVTENLDNATFHRKLIGVPTGFYTPNCEYAGRGNQDCSLEWWPVIKAGWVVPLSQRPLTVSCNGRHHVGNVGQFADRINALNNCKPGGPWSDFSELRGDMFAYEFAPWWQNHSFVICPHGGGIDPSPRAFHAIAAGAIPIVQRFAGMDSIYSELPVAFVSDWGAESISVEKLRRWREQLAPQYEEPELVARVVAKLTMRYWWEVTVNGTAAGKQEVARKGTKNREKNHSGEIARRSKMKKKKTLGETRI